MININVDTLWNGKVGIRDRYIDEANAKQETIVVHYKGKIMTVPLEKLKMKVLFKSSRPFVDKFSSKSHYLYYMNWNEDRVEDKVKPEPRQEKLL